MGAKKKARSKQRKARVIPVTPQPQQAHGVMDDPAFMAAMLVHRKCVCHPDDDLDGLLNHIYANKEVCTRMMAKRMPNLVQSLKEGEISAHEVASCVGPWYDNKFNLGYFSPGNEERMCRRLAEKAMDLGPTVDGRLSETSFNQFVMDLVRSNFIIPSQQVFERVCEAWATKIDRALFKGVQGSFLGQCPIYGMPDGGFMLMLASSISDGEDKISPQLFASASILTTSVMEVKKSCWECRKVVARKDCLLTCSECEAAEYCSKACQSKAWKDGHKQMCSTLDVMYDRLEDSIETIEAAHSPLAPIGNRIRKLSDYALLTVQFSYAPPNLVTSQMRGLNGPSMENFYANFNRVCSGEWWINDRSDTGKQYVSELKSYEETYQRSERDIMDHIVFMLMFDFFGFVNSDTPDDVGKIVAHLLATGSPANLKMPAERFIHLYRTYVFTFDVAENGPMWESRRRCIKEQALTIIRHNYHKSQHFVTKSEACPAMG